MLLVEHCSGKRTMKQCNPDSVTQLAPPFVLANGPSCATWSSLRPAHVIQLTDGQPGEGVTLNITGSTFNGRTIASSPDAARQLKAAANGKGLFFKSGMDLRAPVMTLCAQADIRRK